MESTTTTTLPPFPTSSHLSHHASTFLNHHLKTQHDLSSIPSLISALNKDCSSLTQTLIDLTSKLSVATSDWLSRSREVRSMLRGHQKLCSAAPDGNVKMGHRQKRILADELPILAEEVARIETVRLYAETTLKLEVLVGDLEDATLSILKGTPRNNPFNCLKVSTSTYFGQEEAKVLQAIKATNKIEEILVDVAASRPHWGRLVMAVDSRVGKAMNILRPQVLLNHRTLLVSLGWPPPLTTSNVEKGKSMEIPNPLVLMEGEKKQKYSESFLELCALQHLQVRRITRQHCFLQSLNEHKSSDSMVTRSHSSLEHDLWSIDELVKPIASKMEYYFSRWSDEPKFIFALVYRTTHDFLDGVDSILQPLIDKAALVGCSAREAWVSAMVKMLSKYLERHVFPHLAMKYDSRVENMVINSLWLNLIDLMINFDKKLQVLATSGTPIMGPSVYFEGLLQAVLLFSVFNEHLDWVQIWAEIELKDAQQKLSLELPDKKSWSTGIGQQDGLIPDEETETFLLTTREEYKAPFIADSMMKISWAMMERGQSLPSRSLRIQFIRSSVTLFLNHFFILLLQRVQDVDFMTSDLEDDVLLTIVSSINTARYCESILNAWNEDISILELTVDDQDLDHTFFKDEIMFLVKLHTDCLVEVVSALLLQFDVLSSDYILDIGQWEREESNFKGQMLEFGDMSVSHAFVEALDMLRDRLRVLRLNLNSNDFLDLWRSAAEGLDHFIFSSIPLKDMKFSPHGVDQFKVDVRALFVVFKPFCSRPESFFPRISDSLKLLSMDRKDVSNVLKVLRAGERSEECLKDRGLFHVSADQAEKILHNVKL